MMNKIARKYFLPVLFGSVLVFAIDCEHANMAIPSAGQGGGNVTLNSFNELDDGDFWGKFRESVMKDRDKNDPNGDGSSEPSRAGENDRGDHGENDHGGAGPGGHGSEGVHGGGGNHR